MFDWSELVVIAIVALIFIGPKELPQVLANLGRMTAKLRRSADEFRRHFEDSMRESGYEDLHKNIQDFRALNPANQLKASIDRAVNQDYATKPSEPPSGVPTASAFDPPAASAPEMAGPASALGAEGQKPVEEPLKDHATPVA